MTLDWTSISAAVAAFLALGGSVFSAVAAARSADVAVQAERRAASAARLATQREISRSLAQCLAFVDSALSLLNRADMTAASNANLYREPGKYASTRAEISSRKERVESLGLRLKAIGNVATITDQELVAMQLELDRAGIELENERAWAAIRGGELKEANKALADDLIAEERSRGIYQRRDPSGKLY